MKKANIVPILGISVIVLCILVSTVSSHRDRQAAAQPSPALPVITSEVQPMTVDELQVRLMKVLQASFGSNYYMEVDRETKTFTIDLWTDGFDASVPNAALRYKEYLDKWRNSLELIRSTCEDIQTQVSNHGHPEYAVIIRQVNCDDLGQIFAVAERGEIVYDVVEDTPPGQEVPDPASRVSPTNTDLAYAAYVVNTGSQIFHLPSCTYASQIGESRRATFTGDRQRLIEQGYKPCSYCDP